jgi:hypothetical protein
MQFGGKVFIIGVGKAEQAVRVPDLEALTRLFTREPQIPFMHLSANEIDVSFQYRYAGQVNAYLCVWLRRVFTAILPIQVPESHSPYCWRAHQCPSIGDPSLPARRWRLCFSRCCRPIARCDQSANSGLGTIGIGRMLS